MLLFTQDIGIDLGTANTLVFVKGKGIVIREPSVVAVDVRSNPNRVVAVGSEAESYELFSSYKGKSYDLHTFGSYGG